MDELNSVNIRDAHNVLRKQKKGEESCTDHNCLPIPLNIQKNSQLDMYRT
jgi:hypothetical protein